MTHAYQPSRVPLVALSVLMVGVIALLPACQSMGGDTPIADEQPVPPIELLPTYTELLDAHRTRTQGLDRLWARLVAKLEAERAEALPNGEVIQERIAEQLEGHLQMVQPNRAAINLGKLGDVYLYLGSDGERSWVLDLLDNDNRSGVVYPSRGGAASFGSWLIAIDASDLEFLLGIEPWPDTPAASDDQVNESAADRGPSIAWVPLDDPQESSWGVSITFQDVNGSRAVIVDRDTLAPVKTEIARVIDRDGGVLRVEATLEGMQRVDVRGVHTGAAPGTSPLVPEVINLASFDTEGQPAGLRARLWINDPRARRIRDAAFDIDALIERFGVPEDRIQWLRFEPVSP